MSFNFQMKDFIHLQTSFIDFVYVANVEDVYFLFCGDCVAFAANVRRQ